MEPRSAKTEVLKEITSRNQTVNVKVLIKKSMKSIPKGIGNYFAMVTLKVCLEILILGFA